jgi:hypothetical protein
MYLPHWCIGLVARTPLQPVDPLTIRYDDLPTNDTTAAARGGSIATPPIDVTIPLLPIARLPVRVAGEATKKKKTAKKAAGGTTPSAVNRKVTASTPTAAAGSSALVPKTPQQSSSTLAAPVPASS